MEAFIKANAINKSVIYYFMNNKTGNIYIGKANNLITRLYQHYNWKVVCANESNQIIYNSLAKNTYHNFSFGILFISTTNNDAFLYFVESILIYIFDPYYNILGKKARIRAIEYLEYDSEAPKGTITGLDFLPDYSYFDYAEIIASQPAKKEKERKCQATKDQMSVDRGNAIILFELQTDGSYIVVNYFNSLRDAGTELSADRITITKYLKEELVFRDKYRFVYANPEQLKKPSPKAKSPGTPINIEIKNIDGEFVFLQAFPTKQAAADYLGLKIARFDRILKSTTPFLDDKYKICLADPNGLPINPRFNSVNKPVNVYEKGKDGLKKKKNFFLLSISMGN